MTTRPQQADSASAPVVDAPRRRPGRGAVTAAAVALAALVVLSVLVATGRTQALDDWAKELFRPHDQWGDLQVRVDTIVEGLRPRNSGALLVVVTAVVAVVRRSWWPVVSVAAVVTAGALATVVLKAVVGRADTHGDLGTLSGSYPSGHVLLVLLLAGCTVLLVRERPGPLAWSLVGLAGAVMAWALLVQTAHWLTDVVGAVLIGVAVLALAPLLPFTPAAGSGPFRPDERTPAPRSTPR